MKKDEWNQGLNHLDPLLVEEYIDQKEKLAAQPVKRKIKIRILAIAACS